MRAFPALFFLPLALLAACAGGGAGPARLPAGEVRVPYAATGLEAVIGQDAAGLARLLGEPQADVREGTARRLQFGGAFCVLDAYLYPRGQAAPRVTYVDARQPDGSPIDRASCAAALTRRPEARPGSRP